MKMFKAMDNGNDTVTVTMDTETANMLINSVQRSVYFWQDRPGGTGRVFADEYASILASLAPFKVRTK